MGPRELVRRELYLVFGARITWFAYLAATLLVGHSFVLAVDLYSSASRSAFAYALMRREMDPLAGVLRPMLGGLQLAASVLIPVLGSRGLAVERERRTYLPLALVSGGTARIVVVKALGAALSGLVFVIPVMALLAVFAIAGGHVDVPEVLVALLGYALMLVAFAMVALAAASVTRTVAHAASLALTCTMFTWVVDVSDGFGAFAWLSAAEGLSVTRVVAPFERGIISLGSLGWLVALTCGALVIALSVARVSLGPQKWVTLVRVGVRVGAALVTLTTLTMTLRLRRGYDWSESRRASLPPTVVTALRALPHTLAIEVYLDRDDSRRTQLSRDTLAKLLLARPDLVVSMPLDERAAPRAEERDTGYGRIVIHADTGFRETRSTSRREITTLIFEAADRAAPEWTAPSYSGYPLVIDGRRRWIVGAIAYVGLPVLVVLLGAWATRRKKRKTQGKPSYGAAQADKRG